jgi:hypothetical protein
LSAVVGIPRHFTQPELALVEHLLSALTTPPAYLGDLAFRLVQSLDDGGMGSVRVVSDRDDRKFGGVVVEGEFNDDDATPVLVSIIEDQYGSLFEVDVWKVDFSPLIRIPDPSHIVVKLGQPGVRPSRLDR